mgnify:CR=1 FL=1
MKYSKLAELYEQLDKTTKRLEKTHILSEFLKETPAEDIDKVILLLQGKVFPSWDERKIGFASKPEVKDAVVFRNISFVDTPESEEFRKLSKQGFPYQASIYAVPSVVERV